MVNEHYDPDDSEDAVIDVLRAEHRVNAPLVVAETDLDRATVNHALRDLAMAGWCQKVARGLYEYVEDPRVTGDDGRDERGATPPDAQAVSRVGVGDVPAAIDDAIDAWVPEGQVATETARAALREAVAWLVAHPGPATKSDIVAGAHGGDSSLETWWKRSAQPGLAMLADAELVERPTSKTYELKTE